MNEPAGDEEFSGPQALRRQLEAAHSGLRPGAQHDAAILAAAAQIGTPRAAAAAAATPRVVTLPGARRRWQVPATLAAGLLLGGVITGSMQWAWRPAGTAVAGLEIPAEALRGAAAPAGARSVPVEQADPDAWYRYIEELLAAGRQREALRHLQRFEELHPDYVHQP